MSVSQLVGVVTLVVVLLTAGIAFGRRDQTIQDLQRRVDRLENVQRFLHGNTASYVPTGGSEP